MEKLKDVAGYKGLYLVSEQGHLFSLHGGKMKQIGKKSSSWYSCVRLCKDKKQKPHKIHRLIAEAFIPNPDNKACINHKNGVKSDNRTKNLEWCTHSENQKHAIKSKLKIPASGQRIKKSLWVVDLSTGIFYESIRQASSARGINPYTLSAALRRGKYMDLSYA